MGTEVRRAAGRAQAGKTALCRHTQGSYVGTTLVRGEDRQPNIIARSNEAYGIAARRYVTNMGKASPREAESTPPIEWESEAVLRPRWCRAS